MALLHYFICNNAMKNGKGIPILIGRRPLDGVLSANHLNTMVESHLLIPNGNHTAGGENSIQRRFIS